MTQSLHPAASHHLPMFITAPGHTDVLMVVTGIILVVSVVGFGVLFLRLHSLPERIAHRTHKLQFEIVAVLCLLALFTHVHLFWVAALLLALIEFPDIGGWLGKIAGSVEKIAEKPSQVAAQTPLESLAGVKRDEGPAEAPREMIASGKPGERAVVAPPGPEPTRLPSRTSSLGDAAALVPDQPAPARARS
jgi:hypothetical protein